MAKPAVRLFSAVKAQIGRLHSSSFTFWSPSDHTMQLAVAAISFYVHIHTYKREFGLLVGQNDPPLHTVRCPDVPCPVLWDVPMSPGCDLGSTELTLLETDLKPYFD